MTDFPDELIEAEGLYIPCREVRRQLAAAKAEIERLMGECMRLQGKNTSNREAAALAKVKSRDTVLAQCEGALDKASDLSMSIDQMCGNDREAFDAISEALSAIAGLKEKT